ncbi:hypothetical protein WJX73_009033 [Symbiochloris irregularis]|uniref:Uncharacterized protein n=1 Tax=Symbiochloris irregularis TaxID=706552 RepID=A0AAW1NWF7_9CHLO
MAPAAGSERLRELQLQAARESAVLASDFEPAGSSRLPVSSSTQRVASDSAENLEGRPLVVRHAPTKGIPPHPWRIWFAVFAALVASIFLLWLLFGADDTQLYAATKELSGKPLTASELKLRHPDDPCPSPFWFAADCRTDERTKSHLVHEQCQQVFDELGYSADLLIRCNVIQP